MKGLIVAAMLASLLVAAPVSAGANGDPDTGWAAAYVNAEVTWQVFFFKGERALDAPAAGAQFGREVVLEVPKTMRVTMLADAPDADGRSHTVARMAVFRNGDWQPEKTMEMRAVLSERPSFEYSVDGTDYRFLVIPRLGPRGAD